MRVPIWMIHHLGQKVELTVQHKDSGRTYFPGQTGRLESIQAGRRSHYATVIFDGDETEMEENVQFNWLRPAQ